MCHIRQPTCLNLWLVFTHRTPFFQPQLGFFRTWRMWCFLKPWRELRWIPKLRKSKNRREKKRSRWGEVSRIPRQTPKFFTKDLPEAGATIKNGRRFQPALVSTMFSGFHVKIRERISWDFGLRQKKLVLDQSFWTRIFSTGFFNEVFFCCFNGSIKLKQIFKHLT